MGFTIVAINAVSVKIAVIIGVVVILRSRLQADPTKPKYDK